MDGKLSVGQPTSPAGPQDGKPERDPLNMRYPFCPRNLAAGVLSSTVGGRVTRSKPACDTFVKQAAHGGRKHDDLSREGARRGPPGDGGQLGERPPFGDVDPQPPPGDPPPPPRTLFGVPAH